MFANIVSSSNILHNAHNILTGKQSSTLLNLMLDTEVLVTVRWEQVEGLTSAQIDR